MTISFTIEGIPVPKSYGYSARGWYKSKAARDWENVMGTAALVAAYEVCPTFKKGAYLGEVIISMDFYLPIPASEKHIKEGDPHCRKSKGDVTNLYKSSEDGLKGILFGDDGQVSSAFISKMYSKTPKTCVTVELVDYES